MDYTVQYLEIRTEMMTVAKAKQRQEHASYNRPSIFFDFPPSRDRNRKTLEKSQKSPSPAHRPHASKVQTPHAQSTPLLGGGEGRLAWIAESYGPIGSSGEEAVGRAVGDLQGGSEVTCGGVSGGFSLVA